MNDIDVGVATMGWPFTEVVAWAGEQGVRWVEAMVGPVFGPPGPDDLSLDEILTNGPGRVQDLLAQHNVSLSALAPMLNLLDPDPEVRRHRAEVLRQTIDACAALGVSTAVIYGGSSTGMYFYGLPAVGPKHPSNTMEDNIALFRTVMTPLAAYAEDKGVRIAMETAPRGGGHGNIAHNPALWDRLFEVVPSPALGLSFDPSHLVWLHTAPAPQIMREYASRIFHMDGKDTEIIRSELARQGILGNSWWRYRIPGSGELDWVAIVATLREIGYRGAIDIENEDPFAPGLAGCVQANRFLSSVLTRLADPTLTAQGGIRS